MAALKGRYDISSDKISQKAKFKIVKQERERDETRFSEKKREKEERKKVISNMKAPSFIYVWLQWFMHDGTTNLQGMKIHLVQVMQLCLACIQSSQEQEYVKWSKTEFVLTVVQNKRHVNP